MDNLILTGWFWKDYAIAAAVALRHYKKADIYGVSTHRLPEMLNEVGNKYKEIAILGVGLSGDAELLEKALSKLQKNGVHVRWISALDFPEYKVAYIENNMFLNDRFPFAHASLDGWLTDQEGRKGILEIKTTNILQSMQKEKWNHRIPDNYYIQILHYLMVTEFDFVVLKAQLKSEFNGEIYLQTKHYKIERAEVEEDIKFLESSEKQFWKQIQERKRPGLILPAI